ncbi:FMN-binding glutamate synthase family protein [Rhizobium halophytocola]|uniref:Glutamate synthase domain-containing protein 2 n=1 Tax=Rhizobium halophytocola TaxID=735519 RepID=A0ABS4E4J9_9HYPH|nr:FMN-binding glutamate synthase family protein [Rhizobium halophytocola]MBP1852831.1 glutamate synthase domain-containing protein 2 [Rhizobium halophytocola]
MVALLRRIIIPLVAAILLIVSLVELKHSSWWIVLAGVCSVIVILGLYDFFQQTWTITRNYPVAGRIRWLFYDLRPYLRAYIVEDDLNGTPFSFEARNLVHARARGESDTHPFGTERDTDQNNYHWLSHSIAPAEHPEKSPRVTVGNEQTTKHYSASILNISAMSFGALSANAVKALNLGAKQGGFYHDTGEGGLSDHHLAGGGDIVWELGSAYFGARDKSGHFDPEKFRDGAAHEAVKMTEIKLSQGAKPGHGGLLPAAKVTEEIARVRQVPVHQDALSPRGHTAFSTPIEMLEFAARMRDLSGGKPVGLKLCVGQPHEVFAIIKAILKTGIIPEFIVVDGGEGGTGAAPLELSDWVGMPLKEGLILMRNALVGSGLKPKIRLAASGKVYSGMGIAYNMAMGADWCNAARAFMMSVGCIQAQRCHTGTCPTGVTTQDPARMRALVPQVQAERAARFHAKTLESLADMVAAAGLTHPAELSPHNVMHRQGPEKANTMDNIYAFLPERILIDAPQDTIYADWWEAATAESFKPRTDLERVRAKTSQPAAAE